jgi:hypothetical protein
MFNYDEPFGYSVFCEDIRQEMGNKPSFMGVMIGVIFANEFPIVLPRFSVAMTFFEPRSWALKRDWPVPLSISFPGIGEEISGEIGVPSKDAIESNSRTTLPDDPDIPRGVIFFVGLQMAPITISEPGRIKVRARYADGHIIKMGALRVERQSSEPIPSTAS